MNRIEYFISESLLEKISTRLASWDELSVIDRLWKKDPSVWKENPAEQVEISNRLDWLTLPDTPKEQLVALTEFANSVKGEFDNVFVLGMGGSSLAPEVFAKTFGSQPGFPKLNIVDNTHPANVSSIIANYDMTRSIFLMASKSGGTAETNSFYYAFREELAKTVKNPDSHFVALTDPGTSLEKLAAERSFRNCISTPPDVGGRYSALTPFGALPMAMIGMDVVKFFESAKKIQQECKPGDYAINNPGAKLGAVLGELSLEGFDKVTFITSEAISSFPQWIEQLVAESSGKEGKGILPVEGEPAVDLYTYGADRVFVILKVAGNDEKHLLDSETVLRNAGKPVIVIELEDIYGLAQEIYRWEFATAASCIVLAVNPFDQPNVQLAKSLANESLKTYKETGKLPEEQVAVSDEGIEVLGSGLASTVKEAFTTFLNQSQKGDFAAVLAFTPYGDDISEAILKLKLAILKKYKIAVTSGYGPRFLHSTGQLHKGGKNDGLFIQIVDTATPDLEVPGQGYSFGTLITAQAQGDAKALDDKGRRLLRLRVTGDVAAAITKLADYVG